MLGPENIVFPQSENKIEYLLVVVAVVVAVVVVVAAAEQHQKHS